MALPWFQFPQNIPDEETDIWVRVYWYNGTPFKAQYDSGNQQISDITNGIVYPAWAISRWRYTE